MIVDNLDKLNLNEEGKLQLNHILKLFSDLEGTLDQALINTPSAHVCFMNFKQTRHYAIRALAQNKKYQKVVGGEVYV